MKNIGSTYKFCIVCNQSCSVFKINCNKGATVATYQKRNGRVTATVRVTGHPSQSNTFPTLRDAKAWAVPLEVQLKSENRGNFDHVTLQEAVKLYQETVSPKKKSAAREISWFNFLLNYIEDADLPLSKYDSRYWIDYKENRLEVVKTGTARKELLLISSFFTWCVEIKRYIKINPIAEIKLPPAGNHREIVISQEQIDELLKAAKYEPFAKPKNQQQELAIAFLLAIETGMRAGEIAGLETNRVFLQSSYLRLTSTKNGKPREIPLSTMAKNLLLAAINPDTNKIFSFNARQISSSFHKFRTSYNIEGFTFHDTRHTAATRIAQKIPVLDLCRMFGWSNPKMAMIYYNSTASEIATRL